MLISNNWETVVLILTVRWSKVCLRNDTGVQAMLTDLRANPDHFEWIKVYEQCSVCLILNTFTHSSFHWRASLVTQLVKNLSAMWEMWVQALGWEDPPEEGMATRSNILAWRIPMDRVTWWATIMGSQRVRHNWVTKHSTAQRMCR